MVSMEGEHIFEYKIIVLGTEGSGKTSLIRKLVDNEFSEEKPQPGFELEEVKQKVFHIDKYQVTLHLNDLPLKHEQLTSSYFRSTDAILVLFSVTENPNTVISSLESIIRDSDQYSQRSIKVIVANKIDLPRKIEDEVQEEVCLKGMKYFEVSSKTGENLELPFRSIAETLLQEEYVSSSVYRSKKLSY